MNTISALLVVLIISLVPQDSYSAPSRRSQPLPVILLHGIFSGPESLFMLQQFIEDTLPGVTVYNIDRFNGFWSTVNMWTQLEGIREEMLPIFKRHPEGVNMICYSQGGLTCREVLQTTPSHTVSTFISLASPQAGQFGETDFLKWLIPDFATNNIYKLFYTPLKQKTLSIANYWRDPHHREQYLQRNTYLPVLNGLSGDSNYRDNFTKLNRLVMISGPEDGVITPWQSSFFEFFDENEKIVDFRMQEYYIRDTFGLRTLDEDGKLNMHTVSGVGHLRWVNDFDIFKTYILPYLRPT